MMRQSLALLLTIVCLLGNAPCDAALREVKSSKEEVDIELVEEAQERDLQSPPKAITCGWSPFWRFENDPLYATKNPQKPCLSHADCAGFVAKSIVAPFQPCCLARDCICGSTRIQFQKSDVKCATFACSSDAECGAGACVSGVCSFANVEPACRTNDDCGGGEFNVCHEAVCHVKDANGFLTLVKSNNKNAASGTGKNTAGTSGTGKVKEQSGKTKKAKV